MGDGKQCLPLKTAETVYLLVPKVPLGTSKIPGQTERISHDGIHKNRKFDFTNKHWRLMYDDLQFQELRICWDHFFRRIPSVKLKIIRQPKPVSANLFGFPPP